MAEIDTDGSGQIDREEWREKWVSMQKNLGLGNSLLVISLS